jgi:hypothetical protein
MPTTKELSTDLNRIATEVRAEIAREEKLEARVKQLEAVSEAPPSSTGVADSVTDHEGFLQKLTKRATSAREDEDLVHALVTKAASLENTEARKAFLEKAYGKRLKWYRRRAYWWSVWRWLFMLALASLGVVVAVAVPAENGHTNNTVAIVAGALVTSLTAMYQALRPGVRAQRFNLTRSLLREEGWDYLLSLGRYKRLTPKEVAYDEFASQVSGVIRRFTSSGDGQDNAESGKPPLGQSS